jgi:tRNA(Arg) A34 adenosine deaminase TadA
MAGNVEYFKGVEVTDKPRAPLTATGEELLKMLKIIEDDIIPLTEKGVETGSKMFGAAIIDSDYNCIHPDTNTESMCPTFHAEVKCIVSWSEKTPAKDRGPIAQSSIFLATHEPCMMCISSIVWGGWNRCWYFFGYESTTAQGYVSFVHLVCF